MNVILIRHGMTKGNWENRYIGRTDEPLCEQGRAQVHALATSGRLPQVDRVVVSPYRRCRETAQILFPGQAIRVCDDLRECDFGAFEYRCADEMRLDAQYRTWIESNCMGDIPGGESVRAFQERCCAAFMQIVQREACASIAFVIHGGSIMAILERFARPRRSFYEYCIENSSFVTCTCDKTDGVRLTIKE